MVGCLGSGGGARPTTARTSPIRDLIFHPAQERIVWLSRAYRSLVGDVSLIPRQGSPLMSQSPYIVALEKSVFLGMRMRMLQVRGGCCIDISGSSRLLCGPGEEVDRGQG
eukprot:2514088-Pyramimonas_sp.AAC.1